MNEYIGTKRVRAKPMTRGEYNKLQGWSLPDNEEASDPGFLVEYIDGGPPNNLAFDNYISWSPEDVFKGAYRLTLGMTFGEALESLKMGLRVSRRGWNGKGLWLELNEPEQGSKMTLPYIFMAYPINALNTPGARVPWLASQTDMLAEDWSIVL